MANKTLALLGVISFETDGNGDRFWSKISVGSDDECWPWLAGKARGYGSFGVNIGNNEFLKLYAHRIAYELRNGPIPDGLGVLHRCDNPPCCNPKHLFVGTQGDNAADMVRKGRSSRVGMSRTVNTPAIVREIRAKFPGKTMEEIAAEHGLCRNTVRNILTKQTWAGVS